MTDDTTPDLFGAPPEPVAPLDAQLRRLLTYNAETGEIRWRHDAKIKGRHKAGDLATFVGTGDYLYISLGNGANQAAHRVAWFLHYGKWPDLEIDHRDRNRQNNRIANLRDVTRGVNNANRRHWGVRQVSNGMGGTYWEAMTQPGHTYWTSHGLYLTRDEAAEVARFMDDYGRGQAYTPTPRGESEPKGSARK